MQNRHIPIRAIQTKASEQNFVGTENNPIQAKPVSQEFMKPVRDCLERYWIEQGIPSDKAKRAGEKAIAKILLNTGKGTWCLLPEL